MATQALGNLVYVGSTLNSAEPLFRGGPEELYIKEAASQTFKAGELVYLASGTGKVTVCTATSPIAGVAMTAATGVTDANILIRVIRPDDIYLMQVNSATTDTTSLTHLGGRYGIAVGSNLWSIDIEAVEDGGNSLARVKVIGIPSLTPDSVANTIGDTFGWYYVRFMEQSFATDGNPNTIILQLA